MSSDHPDEQLERARREIRAQAAALRAQPLLERRALDVNSPANNAFADSARMDYRVGELTDTHHRAFLDGAFRALLKRVPSAGEAHAQAALLAAGTSKIEILGNLRWSPEGRRVGARVAGLRPRYLLTKTRRVPVLGYLLDWAIALAGLPLQARHQRAVETYFAARDEAAQDAQRALSQRIDELTGQLAQRAADLDRRDAWLAQRIDDLHAFAHELAVTCDELARTIAAESEAVRGHLASVEGTVQSLASRIDELEFLRRRVHAMNRWSDALSDAFARIDEAARARLAEEGALAIGTAHTFIARDIGRSLRNIEWADAWTRRLPSPAHALSLLCGDDWNTLLRERGVRVIAIPEQAATIEAPREPDTALDALHRLQDGSVDGVAALSVPALLRGAPLTLLLRELQRVLRPRGVLLLAFASEPAAIVDGVLGDASRGGGLEWLDAALVAFGFVDVARTDARDGTHALLAHKGAA